MLEHEEDERDDSAFGVSADEDDSEHRSECDVLSLERSESARLL